MTVEVSAILVAYNSAEGVGETIDRLEAALARLEAEILVIDNASSDGTADVARQHVSRGRVLAQENNLGYGPGVNVGLRHARGRLVLIMNDDIYLAPDTVDRMIAALDSSEDIGLVGARITRTDGSPAPTHRKCLPGWRDEVARIRDFVLRSDRRTAMPTSAKPFEVGFLLAACVLGRTENLRRIGGFNEPFFFYGEDIDLCRRLEALGQRRMVVPNAVAIHDQAIAPTRRYRDREFSSRILAARDRYYRIWISRPSRMLLNLYRGLRPADQPFVARFHLPKAIFDGPSLKHLRFPPPLRQVGVESETPSTRQRPLKILAVINSLEQGGAERSLVEQAIALKGHRIETTILTLRPTLTGFDGEAVAGDVEVIEGAARSRLGSIREVRRYVRSSRFDLVHTTLFDADILGRLASVATGVPVLTSLVNTSYGVARLADANVPSWKLELARLVDGWTARHVNTHFHAISAVVAEASIGEFHIDRKRISVIPRGRDPIRLGEHSSARRARVREALDIGSTAQVFVNVGRHEFQKDQASLVQAAVTLRAQLPHCRILIAGRHGNETRTLQQMIRQHDLTDTVALLGFREDVPDLLCAADAFVFPSRYEGLGGALLEAMALEVPIVATSIPSTIEVLGDAALLVPVADPAALAGAMSEIVTNPDLARRLAETAYARFQARYEFNATIRDMAKLYREIAAGPRRPRTDRAPADDLL